MTQGGSFVAEIVIPARDYEIIPSEISPFQPVTAFAAAFDGGELLIDDSDVSLERETITSRMREVPEVSDEFDSMESPSETRVCTPFDLGRVTLILWEV